MQENPPQLRKWSHKIPSLWTHIVKSTKINVYCSLYREVHHLTQWVHQGVHPPPTLRKFCHPTLESMSITTALQLHEQVKYFQLKTLNLPVITLCYCWLHLSMYIWWKKHVLIGWKQEMFCRGTVEVWGGVRQMFMCKVGSCLLTRFVFNQWTIYCKALRIIFGVVKLQRLILKSKWADCEWEMLLEIEKNKRWAEHADQEHVFNLTFCATVCFNGCQTSNVWPPYTSCLAPY